MPAHIPMELRNAAQNNPNAAIYRYDSRDIEFCRKTYVLKKKIPFGSAPLAELQSDGSLKVFCIGDTGRKTDVQICNLKRRPGRRPKLTAIRDYPEIPEIVLDECHQVIHTAQVQLGRHLAPRTGSLLENQLLMLHIESAVDLESSDVPFNKEKLPLPLESVSAEEFQSLCTHAFP